MEFYEALYEDPSKDMQSAPAEEVPLVMKRAVEKAISQMKNGKSLGEDHVVIDMIKAGG